MSANRSVQAAQRRRTGPTEAVPTRGPQPSINSAQMFANNQSRQAQRPSRQQVENNSSIGNIGKMTVPQAITLITLRLGSLETKLLNINEMVGSGMGMRVDGQENMTVIDQGIIDSISNRLESLEKRSSTSTTSTPEVNLIKQQIETLKQTVIQNKNSNVNLLKENKDLKLEIENLKQDLYQTKELLASIHNITMENNGKIMELSMNCFNDENFEEMDTMDKMNELQDAQYVSNDEIVGINLKEVIEGEINSSFNDE